MNQKNKKLLIRIKYYAIELVKNKQIPRYLYECIMRLSPSSSIEEVMFFKTLSEHYLRIKGYYSKYAELDYQAEKEIKELCKKNNY